MKVDFVVFANSRSEHIRFIFEKGPKYVHVSEMPSLYKCERLYSSCRVDLERAMYHFADNNGGRYHGMLRLTGITMTQCSTMYNWPIGQYIAPELRRSTPLWMDELVDFILLKANSRVSRSCM